VPTDTVAIQIAKAVWVPIYGKKILEKTPFTASLQGDSVWIVKGSLPPVKKLKDGSLRVTYGGVPFAEIMKNDGRILSVYHTR